MQVDETIFRAIAMRLLPASTTLLPDEVVALVHAAQVASGADLVENREEQTVAEMLINDLCQMMHVNAASISPASPLPVGPEEQRDWAVRIAGALMTFGANELAYVMAYLVTVADLHVPPAESEFLEELRYALDLTRERARDLAIEVSSMVTPGVHEVEVRA
jgi:hypothetical protein